MFRKDSLSKKKCAETERLSGKMTFLFLRNIILFFRWKMKDDFSQKNTWKYDIFFKYSEKMVFPKKNRLEYDLSCIIWKDDIPFCRKYDLILWTENER